MAYYDWVPWHPIIQIFSKHCFPIFWFEPFGEVNIYDLKNSETIFADRSMGDWYTFF